MSQDNGHVTVVVNLTVQTSADNLIMEKREVEFVGHGTESTILNRSSICLFVPGGLLCYCLSMVPRG